MRRLGLMGASAMFCDYALFGVLSPLLPYIFRSGAVSTSALEILFMSKGAAQFVSGPFAGYAATVLGPRRSMFVGLVACAASAFLFGATLPQALTGAGAYWPLVAWRSLSGVSSSLIASSAGALQGMATKLQDQQQAYSGLGLLGLGIIAGAVCGPCMAWLARFGVGVPFVVIGCLIVAVLVLHAYISVTLPSDLGEHSHETAMQGLRQLVCDPYMYCCALPLLCAISIEGLVTVAQPLRLAAEPLRLGPGDSVHMFAVFGLSALVTGRLYPRCVGPLLSCPRHVLLGGACMAVGVAMVFLSASQGTIALGNALLGLAMNPIRLAVFMLMFALMDLRKLQVFGFAMALLDMSGCLGYLLGPLFASFFGDSWKCLGVAPAVAVLCVAVLPSFAHEVEDHRVELAKKRQGEQASIGKEIEQVKGYDTAGV